MARFSHEALPHLLSFGEARKRETVPTIKKNFDMSKPGDVAELAAKFVALMDENVNAPFDPQQIRTEVMGEGLSVFNGGCCRTFEGVNGEGGIVHLGLVFHRGSISGEKVEKIIARLREKNIKVRSVDTTDPYLPVRVSFIEQAAQV